MITANERKYGIDVLRILSMLAIVCLHLLNNGGGLVDSGNISITSAILRFAVSIAYSSVNVFAMITGYLYIQRNSVKCSNLVKLILTMLFYCIIATVLFLLFKEEVFADKKMLLYSVFPPIAGKYWYFVSYIFVFLIIPSLNKFVGGISKDQFKSLLIMLFILLSVISTVGLRDYFRINTGYSPFWLIFCYLVGGYIKLYTDDNENKKRRWTYAVLFLLINLSVVGYWTVSVLLFHEPLGFETVVGYVSPLTVCNAILAVLFFSSVEVKTGFARKVILSLSGAAFDVYMIHCQAIVLDVFIADRFVFLDKLSPLGAPLALVGIMIGIYLVCYVIYLLKSLIFRFSGFDRFCTFAGKKMDKVLPLNGFGQFDN